MKIKTMVLCLSLLSVALTSNVAMAQRVTYSEPQRQDDYRNTEVEIIGTVGNNILVYKNNRNNYTLSIFDDNMQLQKNIPMTFLPDNILNVDFITYSDYFQMIFQYQYRSYVYCYGLMITANGEAAGKPVLIDSSEVGTGKVKSKIYSVIHSEDHNQVLIYKINQDKDYNNVFYTFLMGPELNLINNSRLTLPMKTRRTFLSNFMLTNKGEFAFVRVTRAGANGNLEDASLVTKPGTVDSFSVYPLNLQGKYLDEMKLKVDNVGDKLFFASFYTQQRRGDIQGLFAGEYNFDNKNFEQVKFIVFGDDLRMNAKRNSSVNNAFNNYFIRQLVVRSDGGFLLTAESYYTTSGNQPWNRWNYMYSPWGFSPYSSPYYYSPFSPWYYNPYSWYGNQGTRYYYNDVAILSYGADGKLEWSNFIRKEQEDEDNDAFLSYQMVNISSALQFIYNEPFRRSYLLTAASVTPDGKVSKLPTLRGLDRGYEWMPRYGRQVSARSVVIPCIYRNYICFGKIDF